MCLAIVNCRLKKIKKLNIMTAVTCAVVVKNFNFFLSKIKMLNRQSRVSR